MTPDDNYDNEWAEREEQMLRDWQRFEDEKLNKVRFVNDCLYPDWEGGLGREKHTMKSFDKDGFCKVCGMTIEQARLIPFSIVYNDPEVKAIIIENGKDNS